MACSIPGGKGPEVQTVWEMLCAAGTVYSHGSHLRASHDPNTTGTQAAGQELLSKLVFPATPDVLPALGLLTSTV